MSKYTDWGMIHGARAKSCANAIAVEAKNELSSMKATPITRKPKRSFVLWAGFPERLTANGLTSTVKSAPTNTMKIEVRDKGVAND